MIIDIRGLQVAFWVRRTLNGGRSCESDTRGTPLDCGTRFPLARLRDARIVVVG
jgi:hypothetical protein